MKLGIQFEDEDVAGSYIDVVEDEEGNYQVTEDDDSADDTIDDSEETTKNIDKNKQIGKSTSFNQNENFIDIPDEELEELLNDTDEDEDTLINEETEVTEENSTSDDEVNNEDNVIRSFAEELQTKGIFSDISVEALNSLEDVDDLAGLIQSQMDSKILSWESEYKQSVIDNLIEEGIIDKNAVITRTLVDYDEAAIKESEDLQKQVVTEYLKHKGFKEKQIERQIKNSLDLEEDASEYLKELKDIKAEREQATVDKIKAQKEAQAKLVEETNTKWKNTIEETKEFIPNRKINSKFKKEVFDNIIPTFQKVNQNLEKYGTILSFLDKYGILDGNFDKVLNVKSSNTTQNTFEQLLTSRNSKKQTKVNSTSEDNSNFDEELKSALLESIGGNSKRKRK